MKLKQLEGLLGDLQQFSDPKVDLEQYPTGPHIASRLVYTAENSFGDVAGKVVADFGCGCGTLGIASALLGAEHVVGIDIDSESLEIASMNAEDMEVNINLIWSDIKSLRWRGQLVDTVVMNPPFGTRKKGIDLDFLSTALKVASQAVYSLHKTSTREVSLALGLPVLVVARHLRPRPQLPERDKHQKGTATSQSSRPIVGGKQKHLCGRAGRPLPPPRPTVRSVAGLPDESPTDVVAG